jgi:hypothetical protein
MSATGNSSLSLSTKSSITLLLVFWGVIFPCHLFLSLFLFSVLLVCCLLVSWGF